MDPPVCRRSCIPGRAPGKRWTLNNTCLYLTYKGHIPKNEYRDWFKNEVLPSYGRRSKIIDFEIAHETWDTVDREDHTHVIIRLDQVIRSSSRYALAWRNVPLSRSPTADLLVPRISILNTQEEFVLAMY